MSNAILECLWPARGGGLLNGAFEFSTNWSHSGGGSAAIVDSGDAVFGSQVLKHTATSGAVISDQTIVNHIDYAGKRVTALARGWSSYPGVAVGLRVNNSYYYSTAGTGGAQKEYLRYSIELPEDLSTLQFRVRFSQTGGRIGYFDAAALVLGNTHSKVEIDESHIFPIMKPEAVPATILKTVSGQTIGLHEDLIAIDRVYRFEGIEEELYQKLRNFQRYVVCGAAYEFLYTDTDGETYTARMMPSFDDSEEVGPGLYNTTLRLRLKDRGIG